MNLFHEKEMIDQVIKQLEKNIGERARKVDLERRVRSRNQQLIPDIVIEIGSYRFVVEYKSSSLVSIIDSGINHLKRIPPELSGIRLLVVPYMGQAGMDACAKAGISWLDLSGNADVKAPGLRIYIRGHKNKFATRGRKENPFAPKSSRIARRLLYQPNRTWSQRELAEDTGLGEGYVSRIVKSLERQRLVVRDDAGRLHADKPWIMLDAWAQGYDFDKHRIIRGHVPGRSGQEVQKLISNTFINQSVRHAATGLGGAWLYGRFASFRISSFYIEKYPDAAVWEQIGFREVSAGSNVWFIIPKDVDVFWKSKMVENIPVVHEIQVWLDLKYHPERSEEAASELRQNLEL